MEGIAGLFAIVEAKSTPKDVHKNMLTFAIKVGVDTDIPIRKNDELLLIEACLLEYVSETGRFNSDFIDMPMLLEMFPDFAEDDEEEQQRLLNWYNKLTIAMRIMPAEGNKGCLLKLLAKLLEGHGQEYVLGTGATRATNNRIRMYAELGKVVPRTLERVQKPPARKAPNKENATVKFSDEPLVIKRSDSIPEYVTATYDDGTGVMFEDVLSSLSLAPKDADINKVVKRLSSVIGTDPSAVKCNVKSEGNIDIYTAEADVGNVRVTNQVLFRSFSAALEAADDEDMEVRPRVEMSNNFSITQVCKTDEDAEMPSFTGFDGALSSDAMATDSITAVKFQKEITRTQSSLIRTISVTRQHPDYIGVFEELYDIIPELGESVHRSITKEVLNQDSSR